MAAEDGGESNPPLHGGVRLEALRLSTTVDGGRVTLLREISLVIQPREFVAIVGASGTGKTTLLDALSGLRPATSGTVRINGVDSYQHPHAYAGRFGYVPQDDIIHRELTVQEGLGYAAQLRLPDGTPAGTLKQRVADVLEEVDLADRRNLAIGRLSGGQRKRVSIAVELLSRPELIYLDEPTSGLDPGLDLRMMLLLRRLADEGRTIVVTTHATSNITLCDKIVFLGSGGRLCFFGTPQETLTHFGVESFAAIYATLDDDQDGAEAWEHRYSTSPYHERYVSGPLAGAAPAPDGPGHPAPGPTAMDEGRPVSAWQQFGILTRRYVRLLWNDRPTLAFLIGQAPLLGLCLALVSGADIYRDGASFAKAQVALVLLMILNLWVGANTASREIVKEQAIYRRERLVVLRVVPYVLSKLTVLSALNLVQTVLFVSVVALYTGVPDSGVFLPTLLELMLTVWMTGVAGSAMGLAISGAAKNLDLALTLTPTAIIPQMLLCGALFALPAPIDLLGNATIGKWAINSLGTTADLNRMYYATVAGLPQDTSAHALLGEVVFDPHSYDRHPGPKTPEASRESRAPHLLLNWSVLAGWVVLFTGLACLLVKRKDRSRSR